MCSFLCPFLHSYFSPLITKLSSTVSFCLQELPFHFPLHLTYNSIFTFPHIHSKVRNLFLLILEAETTVWLFLSRLKWLLSTHLVAVSISVLSLSLVFYIPKAKPGLSTASSLPRAITSIYETDLFSQRLPPSHPLKKTLEYNFQPSQRLSTWQLCNFLSHSKRTCNLKPFLPENDLSLALLSLTQFCYSKWSPTFSETSDFLKQTVAAPLFSLPFPR